MRVAVLLLMLVLLPLRGWAGGAMALEHTPATATHAVQTAQTATPCHGDASAHSDEEASAHSTPATGHGCSLCDVCHSQLMGLPLALTEPLRTRATAQRPAREAFASATPHPTLKPPKT